MTYDPREGVADQELLRNFDGLVTECTSRNVREANPSEMYVSPASILEREPQEKLDAKRRPSPPGKCGMWRGGGSVERRGVAGVCRVAVVLCPTPSNPIQGISKRGMMDTQPQINVLDHGKSTKGVGDVLYPSATMQPIDNRTQPVPPSRNHRKHIWRGFRNRLALKLLIWP